MKWLLQLLFVIAAFQVVAVRSAVADSCTASVDVYIEQTPIPGKGKKQRFEEELVADAAVECTNSAGEPLNGLCQDRQPWDPSKRDLKQIIRDYGSLENYLASVAETLRIELQATIDVFLAFGGTAEELIVLFEDGC